MCNYYEKDKGSQIESAVAMTHDISGVPPWVKAQMIATRKKVSNKGPIKDKWALTPALKSTYKLGLNSQPKVSLPRLTTKQRWAMGCISQNDIKR